MSLSKQDVLAVLQQVQDPQTDRDLVTLGAVRQIDVVEQEVRVLLEMPGLPAAAAAHISLEIERGVLAFGPEKVGACRVQILGTQQAVPSSPPIQPTIGASDRQQPAPAASPQEQAQENNPLPQVRHIIAVGAGKGGVGKSTVSINLAVGLARTGARVGLMDGDIYGPSVPTMLGTDRMQPQARGQTLLPFEVHGLKTMTIGALVDDDKPLIWRGPMAHGAFKQLATQTHWGPLDYLVIDMPPGTGDVPLTLAQLLPVTGAVVVCTPQKVAQDDAIRAIGMFRQLGIDLLGVVENMSYFIGDDGKEYDIFGKGGAEMMAQTQGLPFLGQLPINMNLRRNADAGDPTANFTGDDQLAAELNALVARLIEQVQAHELDESFAAPTISVR